MIVAPLQSIVVIPARGGSQRVPGKNTRLLAGVPVLERTVTIARESGIADEIFVSTDSGQIAAVASELGVQVIDRPTELADHHTPLLPVMQHAIEVLNDSGLVDTETTVACLYATAITLDPRDFAAARELLISSTAGDSASVNSASVNSASVNSPSFVIGVGPYSHPIQRALEIDQNLNLAPISPEFASTRTQDLPERYFDAGAFIWGRRAAWVQDEPILNRSFGYKLPPWRTVDLDTEADWKRAELVIGLLDRLSE